MWDEGRWTELVDDSLLPKCESTEMMSCINIALLCVQENVSDRPTMLDVTAMLSSKTIIQREPKHPPYFNLRVGNEEASCTTTDTCYVNDVTISTGEEEERSRKRRRSSQGRETRREKTGK